MKIRTQKIFCSFLFLLLAIFSPALFAAQVTGSDQKVMSGQRSQVLLPVTDAKRSPPTRVPSGITLDAALVQEINNNHALLERQTPRLKEKLKKFKQDGYLDRRTKRDLEGSLQDAYSTMSNLRRALQSGQLEAWQLREIARKLNHQGDKLDAGLDKWQKNLGVMGEGTLTADSKKEKSQQAQKQLIQNFSNISRMLHDTGKEIVRQAH